MEVDARLTFEQVTNELLAKGYSKEQINKFTLEEIPKVLKNPFSQITIATKYGSTEIHNYLGESIGNELADFILFPNGTLVITKPRISKYISDGISASRGHTNRRGTYVVDRLPWNAPEYVEYEWDILEAENRDKEKQE